MRQEHIVQPQGAFDNFLEGAAFSRAASLIALGATLAGLGCSDTPIEKLPRPKPSEIQAAPKEWKGEEVRLDGAVTFVRDLSAMRAAKYSLQLQQNVQYVLHTGGGTIDLWDQRSFYLGSGEPLQSIEKISAQYRFKENLTYTFRGELENYKDSTNLYFVIR